MAGRNAWGKIGLAVAEGDRRASNEILSSAAASYRKVRDAGGSHAEGQMAARDAARSMGMNPNTGAPHSREAALGKAAHAKLKAPEAPKKAADGKKPVALTKEHQAALAQYELNGYGPNRARRDAADAHKEASARAEKAKGAIADAEHHEAKAKELEARPRAKSDIDSALSLRKFASERRAEAAEHIAEAKSLADGAERRHAHARAYEEAVEIQRVGRLSPIMQRGAAAKPHPSAEQWTSDSAKARSVRDAIASAEARHSGESAAAPEAPKKTVALTGDLKARDSMSAARGAAPTSMRDRLRDAVAARKAARDGETFEWLTNPVPQRGKPGSKNFQAAQEGVKNPRFGPAALKMRLANDRLDELAAQSKADAKAKMVRREQERAGQGDLFGGYKAKSLNRAEKKAAVRAAAEREAAEKARTLNAPPTRGNRRADMFGNVPGARITGQESRWPNYRVSATVKFKGETYSVSDGSGEKGPHEFRKAGAIDPVTRRPKWAAVDAASVPAPIRKRAETILEGVQRRGDGMPARTPARRAADYAENAARKAAAEQATAAAREAGGRARGYGKALAAGESVKGVSVDIRPSGKASAMHVKFPGKPTPEVIAHMKQGGFKFAPQQKTWWRPVSASYATGGSDYHHQHVGEAIEKMG